MDASRAEGCSSSSIPISPQWVYDVFVSFRGADTHKKFTSHLLAALEDNGFRTFRDDTEPERGEFISNGLLKAIEGSRMSLIVFSKDYAGSRWCLDELVRIMDCRETLKQIVIPIFYDVVPSDVRKQTGVLQDAFAKHKKYLREESDGTVENWRAALSEAANLSGRHLQNEANGDEAELIKMIIEDVRKVNPTRLNVPDSQVGLDRHVAKLNRLLNMEFNRVGIVAIWGMGGIGKTTIAKSLYNLIQHEFEHSGFLANVRETWQRPNGLDELQKKLLLSVLKRPHEVSYFHEGFEDMKRKAIGRKKVLLVLDDVDNDQQLKALAIDRDSFGPGSRIIITTRNKSSLKILKLGENEIYGPEKLDKDESLELFSWHTFKYDHPPEDHLDLSCQIVNYAGGLPLALEVLGSYFRGKSIPQWERAIAKLRKIPTDDVLGKLKISYDSLSEQLKMLFLDMACFFVGIGRDFTIKILKGRYDIFVDDEIQKLADQCLIKYDYHDQIVMHDMIRDMGRELIVGQESLDPGKRSRLWYRDDVLNVLRDGTGTEAVNGLLLNATDVQVNAKLFEKMDKLWQCEDVLEVRRDGMGTEVVECRHQNFIDPKYVQVNAKAFERMNNLWLLHLDYVHLTTGYEHISRRLLWLRWKGFPLDCIPRNFFMQELVALDLRYSSLEKVWNRNMILDKLKFLYLSHCHYLTRTPNFSRLSSLEELLLNDCKSLVEVDKSIRCLNKLLVLDMKNCTKLQKLPSSIWMLKSLESLDLSGCSKLGNLGVFKGPIYKLWCSFFSSWTFTPKGVDSIGLSHTPVQANSCLTKLNLENCHLSYLSEEIGNLISLRTLNLAGNNLSTLPDTIGKLSCLKDLSVDNNKLSHLPSEIGDLDSLETLDLRGNEGLNALPESICKLVHLRSLNLQDCNNLCHLPSEIDGMISLNHLDLGFCNLSHLPCGIGGLTSLEHLYISGSNICTIPDSISSLHRLGSLSLNNCAKLRSLPKLPTRTSVFARHCPSLESLPLELDQLGRCVDYSESNKLAENSYLTSLLKQLPRSKGLSELQHAVNILVPVAGDEEVRIWFPYHEGFPYHDGRGPNVSFVVPRSPSPSINQKMVGWILLLYGRFYGLYIRDVIFNKIEKKGFFNSDFKVDHATHGDHVWLLYIPQGYEGLQLEGGDEVEIPIYARAHEVVKNWAIDVIYGADDELHKGNDTLYQVVGPI